MRWSIRNQLLIPLGTLLLGVAGMGVWTALASAERARQQIEKQVHDVANTVNEATFPRNRQTLKLMKGLAGAEFLLCALGGKPLRDEEGQPLTTLSALPEQLPQPSADWQALHLGPRLAVGGKSYFCQGIHLGREGPWILYIFYPENLWHDALWGAIRPALFFGVVGGLASVVLTLLVAQRLSGRIREMERRTRLIAGGDFSPMPLPSRQDELRDLGRSVNEMAQRLAQFQQRVQQTERLRLLGQVSGGLAHQLRNGVTGARLAVQLHARESTGSGDPETLQVALRQLALVEMHLKRFLDLGRSADLRRQPCPVLPLLEETLALLRPQCRHAGIELRWQPPPFRPEKEPTVRGDADQLRHLLLNVISNGMEAAGPGGWLAVQMDIAEGKNDIMAVPDGEKQKYPLSVIIEVRDSGPGPAPEVAERLFEPFVTGKPEGVGLGLAVGRQVVQALGGSLSWRRETGQTCFRIELPLEIG